LPDHITLFIICVTVVIAVSLLVHIFGLKNKGETLDREQGNACGRRNPRTPTAAAPTDERIRTAT
jgi:hypothetical protein